MKLRINENGIIKEVNKGYTASVQSALDDLYVEDGKIIENYLVDNIDLFLFNTREFYDQIKNKRRKSYSIAYEAMLGLFQTNVNDYLDGKKVRVTSDMIKRWLNKYGVDFKQLLVPIIKKIDEERAEIFGESQKRIKEDLYHHIDNGYSMIDISHTKPIDIIKGWKLTFDGTLDEVDNAFYFEEDEFGGFGGTQFFGIGLLRNSALKNQQSDTYSFDQSDFIKFKFWFNVKLYGDNEDETKIYVDIDNSLIDTDLFEYEVMDEETNIPVDEADDIMFDMAYEIGEAIYSVIQANVTGFGYAE
jgi:hypothetical protein